MARRVIRSRCAVEDKVPAEDLLALDLLMGDPARWPKSVFEGWKLPAGSVPATMRSWGAVQIGMAWLAERGYDLPKASVQHHYDRHVPIVAQSPDDLASAGSADARLAVRPTPTTPSTYLDMYAKGITIGSKALDMMLARLDAMEKQNIPIPMNLLMDIANLGAKLSQSQAGIISRGFDLARQKEEEMAGFRAASAPEASPRFGDHRIRVIDGEARPVKDRGPADRAAYNKTAREDGGPLLPQRG